ncbi:hypothetical protein [Candidatus Venteria ishoeyi]|uniref:Uncharacterized protein n=1 Tax=Candidatus Venteria ishoeyi TaxID=1899563 RepID=A0A1H6FDV1_9GAMM|nr:hypothetical protein [Candidatus Venteria ishoeyi]MDM8545331.1 hypothetical protein [Candidatus Venteria ishoeyi]SEH07214.1 Uncharacterised protein [Candidatus Venteria ishoeyi]
MKISEELRKRIKQLEAEQNTQAQDLAELDSLKDFASIEELEKELSHIDQDMPQATPELQLQDINLEQELLPEVELNDKLVETPELHDIDLSEEMLGQGKPKAKQTTGNYAVCLLFNVKMPSEWSEEAGGGWRGKGQGTQYPSQEAANKALKQLKKKWPDYPIKIMKN